MADDVVTSSVVLFGGGNGNGHSPHGYHNRTWARGRSSPPWVTFTLANRDPSETPRANGDRALVGVMACWRSGPGHRE
jgi:hypothetical protein